MDEQTFHPKVSNFSHKGETLPSHGLVWVNIFRLSQFHNKKLLILITVSTETRPGKGKAPKIWSNAGKIWNFMKKQTRKWISSIISSMLENKLLILRKESNDFLDLEPTELLNFLEKARSDKSCWYKMKKRPKWHWRSTRNSLLISPKAWKK